MNAIRWIAVLLVVAGCAWSGSEAPAQPSDSLDGVWEIVSLIDDGQMLPAKTIKETFIKDARMVIQGQIVQFTTPDGRSRAKTFVTDPRTNPKSLDLAGADKVGNKGIYLLDDDSLIICLNGAEGQARPTSFASRLGQDTVLISLRRVKGVAPPAVNPPPPPRAAAPARNNDEEIRKMLVGTWGHQDDQTVKRITLNADGTFSAVMDYKRGLKKVFDDEERASGRWTVKDGQVTISVTANTDRRNIGQIASFTITTLSATEVVYVDNSTGSRRVEWRIR
jgi:uncharacterized protein (TIGR03067 family)